MIWYNRSLVRIYYVLKPLIPRRFQIYLRRKRAQKIYANVKQRWPINTQTAEQPENWKGWPEGKRFAFVLIHDVDTHKGHQRCRQLMQIEKELEFRSSFNFVPERYAVDPMLRQYLETEGFEVGVHGLKHDGHLFRSEKTFKKRSQRINAYLKDWNVEGFASPAMHHRLEWMHYLNILYGISTFDADPFEPQPDGAGTIFPYFYKDASSPKKHLELPHTLPQDFTLFVILRLSTIDIWKQKIEWIAQNGGMALLNTHPDYMHFSDGNPLLEEYPAALYREFLNYIRQTYQDQFWHVLPKEMAAFWRKRRENHAGQA